MNRLLWSAAALVLIVACAPAEPPTSDTSSGAVADAASSSETIAITEQNYAHAESARNFRNSMLLGADKELFHFRDLPPRGKAAPTVQINSDILYFGYYELPNYDFDEVEAWTARLTAETQGQPFAHKFPRTSADVTDLHQWNLENANGWGGSSPEVGVAKMYTNSVLLSAGECLSTTFEDPESKYLTSVTAYDRDRYLIDGVRNVNSYSWETNDDGTITVSFNCGDDAPNNIDTQGHDFSFTMRYYGVSQKVADGEIAPEKTVE